MCTVKPSSDPFGTKGFFLRDHDAVSKGKKSSGTRKFFQRIKNKLRFHTNNNYVDDEDREADFRVSEAKIKRFQSFRLSRKKNKNDARSLRFLEKKNEEIEDRGTIKERISEMTGGGGGESTPTWRRNEVGGDAELKSDEEESRSGGGKESEDASGDTSYSTERRFLLTELRSSRELLEEKDDDDNEGADRATPLGETSRRSEERFCSLKRHLSKNLKTFSCPSLRTASKATEPSGKSEDGNDPSRELTPLCETFISATERTEESNESSINLSNVSSASFPFFPSPSHRPLSPGLPANHSSRTDVIRLGGGEAMIEFCPREFLLSNRFSSSLADINENFEDDLDRSDLETPDPSLFSRDQGPVVDDRVDSATTFPRRSDTSNYSPAKDTFAEVGGCEVVFRSYAPYDDDLDNQIPLSISVGLLESLANKSWLSSSFSTQGDDFATRSTHSQFDSDSAQGSDGHEDMASLSRTDLADIDKLIAQLNDTRINNLEKFSRQ